MNPTLWGKACSGVTGRTSFGGSVSTSTACCRLLILMPPRIDSSLGRGIDGVRSRCCAFGSG